MEEAFPALVDQTSELAHLVVAEGACRVLVAAAQVVDRLAFQALVAHQEVVDPSSSEGAASWAASGQTEAEDQIHLAAHRA